jgi:hypothetical protein
MRRKVFITLMIGPRPTFTPDGEVASAGWQVVISPKVIAVFYSLDRQQSAASFSKSWPLVPISAPTTPTIISIVLLADCL